MRSPSSVDGVHFLHIKKKLICLSSLLSCFQWTGISSTYWCCSYVPSSSRTLRLTWSCQEWFVEPQCLPWAAGMCPSCTANCASCFCKEEAFHPKQGVSSGWSQWWVVYQNSLPTVAVAAAWEVSLQPTFVAHYQIEQTIALCALLRFCCFFNSTPSNKEH